jgi:hypothetical protein
VKAKPVLGADDILILLTHLWARDTCIFPTEDQRVMFATIMLLLIYTGCRPTELTNASTKKKLKTRPDTDGAYSSTAAGTDTDEAFVNPNSLDDPDYEQEDPWDNDDNAEYDETYEIESSIREYKALCYEDIRLWIVQNPVAGVRDLLAMEITFSHHKGADKKPKP